MVSMYPHACKMLPIINWELKGSFAFSVCIVYLNMQVIFLYTYVC